MKLKTKIKNTWSDKQIITASLKELIKLNKPPVRLRKEETDK